MTRRFLFASLFVGLALSSTGCCGVIRNFVHRVRANHNCYPAFGGGPCCDAGPAYSPSYSIGAPGGYSGLPDPGCAGCGAANVPMGAPGYAGAVPVVPPGTAIFPGMGAKVAGAK